MELYTNANVPPVFMVLIAKSVSRVMIFHVVMVEHAVLLPVQPETQEDFDARVLRD